MEINEIFNQELTIEQNWENDGMLDYSGTKTLDRYHELTKEYDKDFKGIFWAFSDKQFEEGKQKLIKQGYPEDMKLLSFGGGGIGVKEAIDAMYNHIRDIDKKIAAECDAQEVYLYEYNNHESFISWDGDMNAMRKVIGIFGMEIAKKIKRFSTQYSLEEIMG